MSTKAEWTRREGMNKENMERRDYGPIKSEPQRLTSKESKAPIM